MQTDQLAEKRGGNSFAILVASSRSDVVNLDFEHACISTIAEPEEPVKVTGPTCRILKILECRAEQHPSGSARGFARHVELPTPVGTSSAPGGVTSPHRTACYHRMPDFSTPFADVQF